MRSVAQVAPSPGIVPTAPSPVTGICVGLTTSDGGISTTISGAGIPFGAGAGAGGGAGAGIGAGEGTRARSGALAQASGTRISITSTNPIISNLFIGLPPVITLTSIYYNAEKKKRLGD